MKTLLAQAQRLDNGELIEGDATSSNKCTFIQTDPFTSFQVKPETLRYKIGEHYLTVDEIEFCVKDVAKRKAKIDTRTHIQSLKEFFKSRTYLYFEPLIILYRKVFK